jgi:catechol 2,3-dioxygenase-like lactoylglutathione lyase family enzyme
MLDHLVLTVSNLEQSLAFYDQALAPLGITNYVNYDAREGHADLKGYGHQRKAYFWLKVGTPHPEAVHVGFVAQNREAVDAFYAAALQAGGRDNGAPSARLKYYEGYYAAYVYDPDGYNIEAVFKA